MNAILLVWKEEEGRAVISIECIVNECKNLSRCNYKGGSHHFISLLKELPDKKTFPPNGVYSAIE